MNKQDGTFGKKVIAFITSFAFIASAIGVSVALAAITFSNTSITGDSSLVSLLIGGGGMVDSAASSTLFIGNSNATTLTLGRGGQLAAFPGVIAVGTTTQNGTAALTVSSIDTSSTLSIGGTNATTITIGRANQAVSFPGTITGNVSSTAIDYNGAITIGGTSATNIAVGRTNQTVSYPGNVSSTGSVTIGNGTPIVKEACASSSQTIGGLAAGATTTIGFTLAGISTSSAQTYAFGIATSNTAWVDIAFLSLRASSTANNVDVVLKDTSASSSFAAAQGGAVVMSLCYKQF